MLTRSLRGRVTRMVVAALIPLLLLFAGAVYFAVREALYRELDDGLVGRARTLANAVERERQGWEFEFEHEKVPAFARAERPRAYFHIWLPDGEGILRSESLGQRALPRHAGTLANPWLASRRLPDGQPGRLCGIRFAPRLDEDIPEDEAFRYREPVVLVVGQDAGPLHKALATLRLSLAGSVAFVGMIASVLVAWGVRRGLRPLDTVARRIEEMDVRQLNSRIPLEELPDELRGPVAKLNELLGRLEDAFAKERRFTADVSHELRTPVAGLRSVLEVALSRDRDAEEYRKTLKQAHEITSQLSSLAEDLLAIARLDAGQMPVEREPVALRSFVDAQIALHRERATSRGLAIHNTIEADVVCQADPAKLAVVLSNLLSNAIDYTTPDGWVSVSSAPKEGVVLAVDDSGPAVPDEHLSSIFERFWREDRARSATGAHAGIGLPLSKAMCHAHGWDLIASKADHGGMRLRVVSQE